MNRIIVTGASKGIGRAATHRLLNEGYEVVAVDVDRAG
jgi:NAD(P)-dependent dehydrogenase (short-subunit alcohol dehydrogenase family)